ncbi:uncharacterized protein [Antedon mediterranea]|uniref:uncharacterized protein n=1 Tax=Antedon mediterranea TaxID=105859 RepID=UPI003AF7E0BA
MGSNFLLRLLKRKSSLKPRIDNHSLYTSIQMSKVLVEGILTVHEPWRRNQKKPKSVFLSLYTNDSSPFIAWYAEKQRKKARGYFNVRGAKIAPIGEYSFQIIFENSSQIYKFHCECWDDRETWLYTLREQSRKEISVQLFRSNSTEEDKNEPCVNNDRRQGDRPSWKSHRRVVSTGSPLPNFEQNQVVNLQRSRSQPHIQKRRIVRRRPTLSEQKQTGHCKVGNKVSCHQSFIRSPQVKVSRG